MEYDENTALIIVDVQNDFVAPSGSLAVPGGEDVIDFINAQVDAAERSEAVVAYTQDWHPESTPHFEKDGGIWPVHCVAGTWGAEFHPGLTVLNDAIRTKKGVGGEDGYSAFNVRDPAGEISSSTGLADLLRERDVRRVVIVGLALDYCVRESGLDAISEGFETIVLADGTRPVNLSTGDGARAVAALVGAGVVIE